MRTIRLAGQNLTPCAKRALNSPSAPTGTAGRFAECAGNIVGGGDWAAIVSFPTRCVHFEHENHSCCASRVRCGLDSSCSTLLVGCPQRFPSACCDKRI